MVGWFIDRKMLERQLLAWCCRGQSDQAALAPLHQLPPRLRECHAVAAADPDQVPLLELGSNRLGLVVVDAEPIGHAVNRA